MTSFAPYLFSRSICALEESGFRENQKLESMLDSAKITNIDNGQAVQFVQAGKLEPEMAQNKKYSGIQNPETFENQTFWKLIFKWWVL